MPCTSILLTIVVSAAMPDSVMPDSMWADFSTELIEELQDDVGGVGFMDRIRWLQEHPFDLNRVTPVELLALPEVHEADVAAIIKYRKEQRRFRSVNQLLTIEGGSERLYRALRPFAVVKAEAGGMKEGISIRSRALRSYPGDSSATGSPVQSYTRVTLGVSPGIEAGGVFEKDAGELTRDSFLSGYVWTRGLWGCMDAIAGDFSLESGQGLVLWGGTAISKNAWSTSSPEKSARGIVPHRSTDELHFLRGAAATLDLAAGSGRWQGMAFMSQRYLAARTNDEGEVTSLLASGTYDSESLAARKDALRERLAGGRILYTQSETASLGITFVRSTFDRPIRREDPVRFAGNSIDVGGIDFRFTRAQWTLFGEAARTFPGHVAFVGGVSWTLDDRCSVLFLYRDYAQGFDNIHASGFGESGDTRNERGAYVGMACDLRPWLRIRVYYDQFRHAGPTLLTPFPAEGDDLLLNAEADITRSFTITGRYSVKRTETRGDARDAWNRAIHPVSGKVLQHGRLGWVLRAGRRMTVGTRVEFTRVARESGPGGRGFLIYQDLELKPFRPLVLRARLLFFDAETYDARLYEFESDLAGLFSSYPLEGQGRRWYVVARVTPLDGFIVSLKFACGEKEGGVTSEYPFRVIMPLSESRFGVQLDLRL